MRWVKYGSSMTSLDLWAELQLSFPWPLTSAIYPEPRKSAVTTCSHPPADAVRLVSTMFWVDAVRRTVAVANLIQGKSNLSPFVDWRNVAE
jgi:hypothetical protein